MFLGACAGERGGPGIVPVASVEVTPPSAHVNRLDSLQLTATPKDAQGKPLTGRPAIWSTSDAAKASVSPTGLVRTHEAGIVSVTATVEGISGSAGITVVIPVAVVSIEPDSAEMVPTDTIRLVAALYGPTLEPPTDSGIVVWTSSDTARATVSSSGLVSARHSGSVYIHATVGQARDSALIRIAAEVRTILLVPNPLRVVQDGARIAVAVLLDSAGNVLPSRPLTWSSSDPSVAFVLQNGGVSLLHLGQALISASREGVTGTDSVSGFTLALRSIAAGDSHACGVGADSIAYCWGGDWYGQLGDSLSDVAGPYPVPTAGTQRFSLIEAGDFHTCGLTAAGAAWCWGLNIWGQAAAPAPTIQRYPIPVPSGGIAFAGITGGQYHTCALDTAGAASCWGMNMMGQLGDSVIDVDVHASPVPVRGGLAFGEITAGGYHTCGLTTTGAAYCWGANAEGQLGTGDTATRSYPVPVGGNKTFASVDAGGWHTCALDSSGAAFCWGLNHDGQLGTGDTASSTQPVPVVGGLVFTSLTVGSYHSCGLIATGAAYCWGRGDLLGTGSGTSESQPTAVAGGLRFVRFSAGAGQTCGLTVDELVYCWNGGSAPTKVWGQP